MFVGKKKQKKRKHCARYSVKQLPILRNNKNILTVKFISERRALFWEYFNNLFVPINFTQFYSNLLKETAVRIMI